MWNSEEMWSNFVEFCEGLEEFSVNLEDFVELSGDAKELFGTVGACVKMWLNCQDLHKEVE